MTEYWKSTPKYWCKHCKTFVRDTPLEKNNHEATARHQGNLKRFLRDLHKGHERAEQATERAKAEVARLNALVDGPGSSSSPSGSTAASAVAGSKSSPSTAVKPPARAATAEERNRQMAQLASMGVVVPEHYRRENAMTGDWTTVVDSTMPPAIPPIKSENKADPTVDSKAGSSLGVHKRKVPAEELDAETEETSTRKTTKRRNWGTDVRQLADDSDLDGLLRSVSAGRRTKQEDTAEGTSAAVAVKSEPDESRQIDELPNSSASIAQSPEQAATENDGADLQDVAVMFKKRKPKKTAPE